MNTNPSTNTKDAYRPLDLPAIGKVRWPSIKPHVGVCRNTWTTMGKEGRAPRPIRLTERCTVWDASEIRRWIADPVNYRAE
ncbi:helix-turn-helix transcriptional regulator [Paraburkholderia phenoliruptrix]|uniref:helix-turn-helix transcriptional regulator n=1 Tax=Paraburkholderia phenoliruptrix TaxID=252970 RepID=UPI003D9941A2